MTSLVKGLFDKHEKVKGTVVLMQKNVLDINELTAAQSPTGIIGGAIGAIGDVAGNILDTASSFLGRSIALKLISATSADGNNSFLFLIFYI
jgi:linoleate 9S-lipoxygenase